MPDTTVQVGRIGADLEGRPVSIATRSCHDDGRIGSFVVVPSGEADDEFAIKVILGHGGRTAVGCRSDESGSGMLPGCIFARRGLRYLPHTELTLPIAMRGDCDGILCRDQGTTCVHGSCVPAVIPDPGSCRGAGCPDTVLGPAMVDAGALDAKPDGSSDAFDDTTDDAPADTGSFDGPGGSDAREATAPDADAANPPPSDACPDASCTPPSCAVPLACGAAGDSCCTSLLVTGDSFLRRNDPPYPAKVSDFRLDKYETTVGRFRAFVAASVNWRPQPGSGKHVHLPGGGLYDTNKLAIEAGWNPAWDSKVPQAKTVWNNSLDCILTNWTPDPGPNESEPIVCVDWFEAYAFCIWDGGFLPSYTEWNYAFVGGKEQRQYPWGDGPLDLAHAQYCPSGGSCPTSLINVGSKPPGNGRYGHADLAGNVYEWMLDSRSMANSCTDCVGLDPMGLEALTVGGGWDADGTALMADFIGYDSTDHRDYGDGFRCARPP
jgi:formylglycine-generating enzyme required for sulfatase activity